MHGDEGPRLAPGPSIEARRFTRLLGGLGLRRVLGGRTLGDDQLGEHAEALERRREALRHAVLDDHAIAGGEIGSVALAVCTSVTRALTIR